MHISSKNRNKIRNSPPHTIVYGVGYLQKWKEKLFNQYSVTSANNTTTAKTITKRNNNKLTTIIITVNNYNNNYHSHNCL